MNNTIEARLNSNLRDLFLSTMRKSYGEIAARAQQESLSYESYLLALTEEECTARYNNRIERYLRQSRLPLEKNWDSFDKKRIPAKVIHQVNSLLDGAFLNRNENVLVFGNPGSGKTHLVCALAQELVRKGKRVYFSTCALLLQELLVAKRELQLPKVMKKMSKYDAVIIDDIGYVQQEKEEMEVLFTLLAEKYERGSLMITSNLPFSKWENIFKDTMMTAAAIDRIVHHSVILELNIPSYRMNQAKRKKIEQ